MIFLAEASPIADRRKLPCVYYKNKISITICDFLRGAEGGGGLQKNVHMTFLMDKIDMIVDMRLPLINHPARH